MKNLCLLLLGSGLATFAFHTEAAPYSLVTREIQLNGHNLFADSFNSLDPLRSTGGQYDPLKAGGDQSLVASETGILNSINVGTVEIWGGLDTGSAFSLSMGPQSSIGSAGWHQSSQTGIEPGFHGTNLVWQFPDVAVPYFAGLVPASGTYNGVFYNYILESGDYTMASLTMAGSQKMLVKGSARLDIKGNINLSGNSQILVLPDASLQLYVEGTTADIRGNGIINQGVARHFTYFGTAANAEVNLRVSTPFVGLIYAPNAVCTVTAGGNAAANLQGAVVSRSVVLGADLEFHFDEGLEQ